MFYFYSLLIYLKNPADNLGTYMASPMGMDNFIDTVINTCDFIKAKKRSKKTMYLSFDEWNVWFHSLKQDDDLLSRNPWVVGPPLLEDIYNLEDALVVGGMINALLRHSDRVKIGCLAQLVNVIAPIMTENDDSVWKQTIFYPFYDASLYSQGTVLQTVVNSPSYTNELYGDVPYLDACTVYNEKAGELVLFIINRNPDSEMGLDVQFGNFTKLALKEHIQLTHKDRKAVNTKETPDNVVPCWVETLAVQGNAVKGPLALLSWNCIRLSIR